MPLNAQAAPREASAAAPQVLARRPFGLLTYWHLLSLDAPTVAALWTWFIARCAHLTLPLASPVAVFFAVWILYAADRLLDARVLHHLAHPPGLEARHFFHFHHRARFRPALALCSVGLAPLLLALPREMMRLYLIAAALLCAWLLLIHLQPRHSSSGADRIPKEFAVGAFFAAAVFIPAVSRLPALRPTLLAPALLFAALCTLNCLFIYAWEHDSASCGSLVQTCHLTTRVALRHIELLAFALIAAALLLPSLAPEPARAQVSPLCLSIALASSLLLLLHFLHGPLDLHNQPSRSIAFRAAADLALLTPLLFAPFVR